jgi:hypothetical protein
MKRILLALTLIAIFAVPNLARAAGVCVTVNVANTSGGTQVLAANDLGSGGRHMLCLWNSTIPVSAGATTPVEYCTIGGGTPVNGQGIPLMAGALGGATWAQTPAQPFCFPPTQQNARTFPIVPSGQILCIGSVATTDLVTACDF